MIGTQFNILFIRFITYFLALALGLVATGCDNMSELLHFQGNPISWNRNSLPISMLYDEDTMDHATLNSLFNAARASRNAFGDVFSFPITWPKEEPIVAPRGTTFFHVVQELDEDKDMATTSHNIDSDASTIASVDVYLKCLPDDIMGVFIILHELGHVLGLAHDPFQPCSIMYPFVTSSCPLAHRQFTSDDIQIIKDLYRK